MDKQLADNKAVVLRFNKAFLEEGNESVLPELLHPQFINRTTPPGVDPGIEGIRFFIKDIMHKAFPDLKVEILQMIAEGDLVNTYKVFHGTHSGDFMGIAPTGKEIKLYVMDIVRLQGGQYIEHWGIRDTHALLQQLNSK